MSFCLGCSGTQTRDPNVYNGPVVNPQAPGVAGAHKVFGHSGKLYTAAPGQQTGIPK